MKLKLLEVLRNNDSNKLLELINQIDEDPNNYDLLTLKSELLLFAVQVGPLAIIKFIVSHNIIDDINSQDSQGNTSLHLAAISNRVDVIKFLLQLDNINDCLVNKDLKQPIQCTTNLETAQLMDHLRAKHIEKIASQLRQGFETRNFELLDKLLTNPRDKELLDINGTDPITSDTVLIEFVKKNDHEMVKFILAHGGDPFKRNVSGKLPEESTTDPEMKKILEESFNNQNMMDPTNNHNQNGSPTFKGFLKKWTNFAGGYKLRWFVLDSQARLSYYKSPNDMNNTCRGMIHLAHAMLKVDSSENTKFEIIIQNPSDGSPVRWHLIAKHSTEAQKWIWVLQNAIKYAKDYEKMQRRSVVLSHILHEDLPDNQHSPHQPFHSAISPISATIPESDVLSNEIIEHENETHRPVSSIISDAKDAANEFKDLVKVTDSDADLPLKIYASETDSTHSNNNSNSNHGDNIEESIDNVLDNDQNTNSNDSNSLRNQTGPVPDRSSQYSGSKSSHENFNYNHARASSVQSFNSTKSNSSEHSKTSRAKNLYKKPLKTLSHLGKKTRKSFVVEPKQTNNSFYDNSSYMSNDSSINVPEKPEEITETNEENEIEEEEEEEEEEEDSPIVKSTIVNTDLNVVRNQINIQLNTFKDFLESAVSDNSISKDDLVQMSTGILSTLDILINQEGECINFKYNELVKRLGKQQKISSIWENSIKQLELEIRDREGKIVELEDKLKAVKKSLRNSVSQLNQSHINHKAVDHLAVLPDEHEQSGNATSAAALARQALTANMNKSNNIPPIPTSAPPFDLIKQQQMKEEQKALQYQKSIQQNYPKQSPERKAPPPMPSYEPPQVSIDPTLTEFLEESDDSDDEFFDAEESDVVKDMSVLERRETLRVRKNRKSSIDAASNLPQEPSMPAYQPPAPPVSISQAPSAPQAILNIPNDFNDENSSIQNSENESFTAEPEQPIEETETIKEPNFKPKIDQHGHYIVNKHELVNNSQQNRYNTILNEHSFEGYEDPLRLTLAPEDNRPKISLWGVLKSLVGKDMTKMTLPVSFNEPTSLLQRNVEVIEYSDLLDKASAIEASTLRLVYVATFAASEYASTVGRIAKPFNPLLGETFEYARPDKGYRCFVEQVSHHPPISALVAESPSWSYYGESNVKTKFLGRSFDIKHLGTWFCELYPDAGVECKDGTKSVKEIYSWKKVNNSVIGIIVGNPTIDNYGEMEIHNHMTGDYMKFTFKPRGWRASSAYEVKGEVFNAKGKLRYYVGGHWNSKIFCKPADDKNAERFLVWEAAPRKEMMFHLTNFAATLNAPLPHLLPQVACTDTRLRPDQRAMENGDYDLAAEEKNRVEEKQREVRRQREMKGEIYKPTFFAKDKHPVTGEEFWRYKGTYWEERKENKLKDYNNIF